jgi:ribonuclease BN (tRNA processing enzyme)
MWGGFPKKNAACTGFLIQENDFSLLLDCGSGVVPLMQNYIDLNQLHHVLLSHYHYDHFSDLGVLLFSRLVNTQLKRTNQVLQIYGPDDELIRSRVEEVSFSAFKAYTEDSKLTIGPFQITFKKNQHPVEAYAIKIESSDKRLVFTSDTSFTEELIDFCQGVDLLVTECSLYDGMNGAQAGHMNAKEAGILAHRSQAKKVILSHLPHYGELNELLVTAKQEGNKNIRLAEAGLMIEV